MRILVWLRSAFVAIFIFPLHTLVFSVPVIVTALFNAKKCGESLAAHWASGALWMFGVKCKAQGLENIPTGACLFLFNHTSFMDIFALQSLVPSIHFGAKVELFQIPIFGWALRANGILPIARGNREQVMRVYQEAEPRVKAGEKFALAPEGSRSQHPETLLPFKSGPFIFAIRSGMPIIPVVIQGAHEAWPKGELVPATQSWRSTIHVNFLPVMSVQSYSIEQRGELASRVRQIMQDHLL